MLIKLGGLHLPPLEAGCPDLTLLTPDRDRLQNGEVFAKFMTKLLNHPQVSRCCRTNIFPWTER